MLQVTHELGSSPRHSGTISVVLNSGPGARKSLHPKSRAPGPLFNTKPIVCADAHLRGISNIASSNPIQLSVKYIS